MSSYPKSNPLLKPTVLTDRVKAEIIQLLAEGNFLSTACRAAGISQRIFDHWRKRWEEEDASAAHHADFFLAVDRASAIAETDAVRAIRAGDPGWQGNLAFIERRFQKRWGKKVQVALPSGKKPEDMTDAELEAAAKGKSGDRA